jgi:hypothetical protein
VVPNLQRGSAVPSPRRYLSKPELMALTGLSAATIQRYKNSGKIACFQPGGPGGKVLFPLDAIEVARQQITNDQQRHTEVSELGGQLPSGGGEPLRPAKLRGPRPRWQA